MTDKPAPQSEIILYRTEDGRVRIETRFFAETAWLSLNQMAELFQRDKSVISRHLKNIFEEGELKRDRVIANFATTAADRKTYQVEFYNLDVIISLGYRVKSHQGTQFRIWATQRLREYIIKGFTLDDERLKRRARKSRPGSIRKQSSGLGKDLPSFTAKKGTWRSSPLSRGNSLSVRAATLTRRSRKIRAR